MTLHIISSAPNQSQAFEDCLRVFNPLEDVILLLGDAVYALVLDSASKALSKGSVHVFEHDLQARGISPTKRAIAITANELVTLTEQHSNSVTWS